MTSKLRWHLGHLDALRGIAVLGVILVHSGGPSALPPRLHSIAVSGQRGVQLFFIVSALTLFLSFDNRREEHHPTTNFFLRRFFRLAPMWYVATLLSCLLTPQLAGPPIDIALAVVFLHGLTPRAIMHGPLGGWSVADEVFFYLCLPFLFRRLRDLKSASQWLFIAAPCLFVLSYALKARFEHYAYFTFLWFPVEFPVFLMGILTYFLLKDHLAGRKDKTPEETKQRSLLLLCLVAVVYGLNLPFLNSKLYLSSIACSLLVIALTLHPWPVLVNRFTIFLGRISYSVYLLHFHVLIALQALLNKNSSRSSAIASHPVVVSAILFLVTLGITMFLASLTWRFIEEPGIRLGRRLVASLEGRALQMKEANLIPPLKALRETGNSPDAQF